MKKMMVCGLALLASLTFGNVAGAETVSNSVEVRPTVKSVPVANGNYIESDEIFKTASLHRGQLVSEYCLAKYDTIQLTVLGFPEGLGYSTGSTDGTGDVITIGPDGYASLPYVGRLKLAGLTLDEAGDLIKERLSRYIKIPEMHVSIKSYGPRKVYVMGEVSNPGIHDMGIDNLNAYAAITSAGGFAKRARSTRVQVIRVVDNTMYYRQLNMKSFIKRHDLTQNVEIMDGDIVYVPRSNAVFWQEDILPYFQAWTYYKAITD